MPQQAVPEIPVLGAEHEPLIKATKIDQQLPPEQGCVSLNGHSPPAVPTHLMLLPVAIEGL